MKILILYQDIDGGTKNATESLISELKLKYKQHKFYVYKQKDPKFKNFLRYTRHLIWSVNDFRRVINNYKNKNIDCIYHTIYSAAISKKLSSLRKTVGIFHFHGNQEFANDLIADKKRNIIGKSYSYLLGLCVNYFQKHALLDSQKIFFVSKLSKNNFLKKHQLKKINHKITVINNGVDTNLFKPINNKQKIKLRKKILPKLNIRKKIILYTGRIDEKKGIHKLIKAISMLKNIDRYQLLIAYPEIREKQSQNYLKILYQRIKDLKITKNVTFIKDYRPFQEIYQIADLTILPSDREFCPLVLLEALSSGTCFMGSNVGSIPEFLSQIDNKLIIKRVSAKEIAKKINWFFNLNNSQKKKIIEKGLKIAKNYSWNKTAQAIFEEISQLFQY